MNNKRPLLSTSPEQIDNINKRHSPGLTMSVENQQDVFSWDKLCGLLDEKLKDVTRKEDLAAINYEIEELKNENTKLKDDIKKLTTRIETIDRKSRATNIVVNGLNCTAVSSAKTKFMDICKNILKVEANIIATKIMSSGKSCLFNLETSSQAIGVLSAKRLLKGQQIYIHKDYTEDEQFSRYNLRQISKNISKSKKDVKVRLGEFSIFINDKKFNWFNGKVKAQTNNDAEYLRKLFNECGCSYDVVCNDKFSSNKKNTNPNTNYSI